MKNIEFIPDAYSEYQRWIEIDRRIALEIGDLIRDIARTLFSGLGKPEAFFNPHIRSSASLRKSPQRHLAPHLWLLQHIHLLICESVAKFFVYPPESQTTKARPMPLL